MSDDPVQRPSDALRRADLDFALPDGLIARYPTERRTGSRLLHVDPAAALTHYRFADIGRLLRAGDLLVFNDTRVIPARLHGRKASGGRVELLVERLLGEDVALCQIRGGKSLAAGSTIRLHGDAAGVEAERNGTVPAADAADVTEVTVQGRDGPFFRVDFPGRLLDVLERFGEVPLPPYVDRPPQALDRERYQTVFARNDGAVAAPTAGLHFDEPLLQALAAAGVEQTFVTLHVGAGTFQPIRADDVRDHRMHAEWMEVGAAACAALDRCRARGGRIVAVGTTSVRSLESLALQQQAAGALRPWRGDTRLYIRPGHRFRLVDALITNFHLPGSSLLLLVGAFVGLQQLLAAYRVAIDERYRFFSYGDAMFLEPPEGP